MIMRWLMFLLIIGTLSGCTNSSDAHRALENSGYTDVQITGYDFFACSGDDFFHTGFTAKNLNGVEVQGTVCSGLLFKNATIRF